MRTQAVALKSLLSVESEGHVLVRKVKKLNSLRPMLLSYFQKTSRVGPRDPPPAGIGLRSQENIDLDGLNPKIILSGENACICLF